MAVLRPYWYQNGTGTHGCTAVVDRTSAPLVYRYATVYGCDIAVTRTIKDTALAPHGKTCPLATSQTAKKKSFRPQMPISLVPLSCVNRPPIAKASSLITRKSMVAGC